MNKDVDKIEDLAAGPIVTGQKNPLLDSKQMRVGTATPPIRGEYYDHDRTIAVAGPVNPNNYSSPVYNREKVHEDLGQNAELIQVINRGKDNLVVICSHAGTQDFADETTISPGTTKLYINVYELRCRSPTKDLPYTVTEFYTEINCCPETEPVSVSGNIVEISGQAVTTSVSGDIVQISGQSVTTVVEISGSAVTVSGDVVQISGQAVSTSVSGDIVSTSISGNIVLISGQAVTTSVSGDIIQISGQGVNISGQGVNISGQGVNISGQAVTVSGDIIQISGQAVTTSISGDIVLISGQAVTIAAPSSVVNTSANPLSITGASGGVALSSGVTVSVVMKAIATNSGDIYVGGSAGRPFSGFGYVMSQGDTLSLDINNFNAIYLCAAISGDRVSYIGID